MVSPEQSTQVRIPRSLCRNRANKSFSTNALPLAPLPHAHHQRASLLALGLKHVHNNLHTLQPPPRALPSHPHHLPAKPRLYDSLRHQYWSAASRYRIIRLQYPSRYGYDHCRHLRRLFTPPIELHWDYICCSGRRFLGADRSVQRCGPCCRSYRSVGRRQGCREDVSQVVLCRFLTRRTVRGSTQQTAE
jgi:hypothetical protein